AGEIEREGSIRVEVVPLDQIADRPDEDRRQAAPHVGELELSFLDLRHDPAFSAARYLRTRAAFAPISPPPTRDSDRTSTRLPFSCGCTRTTTSSLKPNQKVVSVASMRPPAGSDATRSHPIVRTAASARSKARAGGRFNVSGTISG